MSPIHVLKFGGTSLQNHNFIRQAANITSARMSAARPVVVVSAIGGVTTQLIKLADDIVNEPDLAGRQIRLLRELHLDLFGRLVGEPDYRREEIAAVFSELKKAVFDREFHHKNRAAWRDRILSTGEQASAALFTAVLNHSGIIAETCDATGFIRTDSNFGRAGVMHRETREAIKKRLENVEHVPVITGFIGANRHGEVTTLGRSGSDFTAGLVADALNAEKLEIWTDVNGVLTADPRWVSTAKNISKLSIDDIGELAVHGASVIHPDTIAPISGGEVTVAIKNSYDPSHPGTLIHKNFFTNGSFENITITGPFICFRVPDSIAFQLTEFLEERLEDSNHDGETFSCRRFSKYEQALFTLSREAFQYIRDSLVDRLSAHKLDCTYRKNIFRLKKFSNRFKKSEALTGRVLSLLAHKNISPLDIQRHPDERYLSLLLDKEDTLKSARLINDYLDGRATCVDLFIAGTGAVGGMLLEQLEWIRKKRDNIHFRLLGACNSRFMAWNDHGLNQSEIPFLKGQESRKTDWSYIVNKLREPVRHNVIFIDATGSEEVARIYPKLLESGIHIATPSKLANTFDQSYYDYIHQLTRNNGARYHYETTVGAGLPLLSTIKDLVNSGDRILEISGVVSGTMTYLFTQLENGTPFSEAIKEARDKGFAEPDPRDDLTGEDVARKFLILARAAGFQLNREEVEVESLVPERLSGLEYPSFLEALPEANRSWKERIAQARARDETLRYTGTLSRQQGVSVGVESVPIHSPLGQLSGTDNLVRIKTERYRESPIIIQGPGAGREVTAAGLLADILKIAEAV